MKQQYYWIIGIMAIAGAILMSGCVKHKVGPARSPACSWVFKTRGNYSDLVPVRLFRFQNETRVAEYPIFGGRIKKLHQGYYIGRHGCYPKEMIENVVFTSITWDEWRQSQEDCIQQMKKKKDQLRIQKCGSLDFDIFEECNTFTVPGKRICKETVPPKNVTNPTKCTYDITLEESKWVNSCEPLISADDFLNNIIDYDPFTELYLCRIGDIDTLNSIIDNGELDIKCKKII